MEEKDKLGYEFGQLAIVSTPIGNLGDLSPRACKSLEEVDIIACEDTRNTRKLLSLSNIKTKARLLSYNDHNGPKIRPKLISQLLAGKNIALVCDAGTPLISDPGFKLVSSCHRANIKVTAVPGPCAVIASMTISGLPSDKFLFAGFVPQNKNSAMKTFREFSNLSVTSIWFESPRRVTSTLDRMADIFGDRDAVVTREITKVFEDYKHGTIQELAQHYKTAPPPKGEIVILLAGAPTSSNLVSDDELISMLRSEMKQNSLKNSVNNVKKISGKSRKIIYDLAIKLAKSEE